MGIDAPLQKHFALQGGVARPIFFDKLIYNLLGKITKTYTKISRNGDWYKSWPLIQDKLWLY